ncbi:hypothetical protein BJ742DRAFT_870407 [Cladochytrium replicatum]|nr:hypothetical protein BJ742DRAFT_870407 [Cladochytrium replicatum]
MHPPKLNTSLAQNQQHHATYASVTKQHPAVANTPTPTSLSMQSPFTSSQQLFNALLALPSLPQSKFLYRDTFQLAPSSSTASPNSAVDTSTLRAEDRFDKIRFNAKVLVTEIVLVPTGYKLSFAVPNPNGPPGGTTSVDFFGSTAPPAFDVKISYLTARRPRPAAQTPTSQSPSLASSSTPSTPQQTQLVEHYVPLLREPYQFDEQNGIQRIRFDTILSRTELLRTLTESIKFSGRYHALSVCVFGLPHDLLVREAALALQTIPSSLSSAPTSPDPNTTSAHPAITDAVPPTSDVSAPPKQMTFPLPPTPAPRERRTSIDTPTYPPLPKIVETAEDVSFDDDIQNIDDREESEPVEAVYEEEEESTSRVVHPHLDAWWHKVGPRGTLELRILKYHASPDLTLSDQRKLQLDQERNEDFSRRAKADFDSVRNSSNSLRKLNAAQRSASFEHGESLRETLNQTVDKLVNACAFGLSDDDFEEIIRSIGWSLDMYNGIQTPPLFRTGIELFNLVCAADLRAGPLCVKHGIISNLIEVLTSPYVASTTSRRVLFAFISSCDAPDVAEALKKSERLRNFSTTGADGAHAVLRFKLDCFDAWKGLSECVQTDPHCVRKWIRTLANGMEKMRATRTPDVPSGAAPLGLKSAGVANFMEEGSVAVIRTVSFGWARKYDLLRGLQGYFEQHTKDAISLLAAMLQVGEGSLYLASTLQRGESTAIEAFAQILERKYEKSLDSEYRDRVRRSLDLWQFGEVYGFRSAGEGAVGLLGELDVERFIESCGEVPTSWSETKKSDSSKNSQIDDQKESSQIAESSLHFLVILTYAMNSIAAVDRLKYLSSKLINEGDDELLEKEILDVFTAIGETMVYHVGKSSVISAVVTMDVLPNLLRLLPPPESWTLTSPTGSRRGSFVSLQGWVGESALPIGGAATPTGFAADVSGKGWGAYVLDVVVCVLSSPLGLTKALEVGVELTRILTDLKIFMRKRGVHAYHPLLNLRPIVEALAAFRTGGVTGLLDHFIKPAWERGGVHAVGVSESIREQEAWSIPADNGSAVSVHGAFVVEEMEDISSVTGWIACLRLVMRCCALEDGVLAAAGYVNERGFVRTDGVVGSSMGLVGWLERTLEKAGETLERIGGLVAVEDSGDVAGGMFGASSPEAISSPKPGAPVKFLMSRTLGAEVTALRGAVLELVHVGVRLLWKILKASYDTQLLSVMETEREWASGWEPEFVLGGASEEIVKVIPPARANSWISKQTYYATRDQQQQSASELLQGEFADIAANIKQRRAETKTGVLEISNQSQQANQMFVDEMPSEQGVKLTSDQSLAILNARVARPIYPLDHLPQLLVRLLYALDSLDLAVNCDGSSCKHLQRIKLDPSVISWNEIDVLLVRCFVAGVLGGLVDIVAIITEKSISDHSMDGADKLEYQVRGERVDAIGSDSIYYRPRYLVPIHSVVSVVLESVLVEEPSRLFHGLQIFYFLLPITSGDAPLMRYWTKELQMVSSEIVKLIQVAGETSHNSLHQMLRVIIETIISIEVGAEFKDSKDEGLQMMMINAIIKEAESRLALVSEQHQTSLGNWLSLSGFVSKLGNEPIRTKIVQLLINALGKIPSHDTAFTSLVQTLKMSLKISDCATNLLDLFTSTNDVMVKQACLEVMGCALDSESGFISLSIEQSAEVLLAQWPIQLWTYLETPQSNLGVSESALFLILKMFCKMADKLSPHFCLGANAKDDLSKMLQKRCSVLNDMSQDYVIAGMVLQCLQDTCTDNMKIDSAFEMGSLPDKLSVFRANNETEESSLECENRFTTFVGAELPQFSFGKRIKLSTVGELRLSELHQIGFLSQFQKELQLQQGGMKHSNGAGPGSGQSLSGRKANYRQYQRNEFRTSHVNRKANTSRPPSMHVDDFMKTGGVGVAPTSSTTRPTAIPTASGIQQFSNQQQYQKPGYMRGLNEGSMPLQQMAPAQQSIIGPTIIPNSQPSSSGHSPSFGNSSTFSQPVGVPYGFDMYGNPLGQAMGNQIHRRVPIVSQPIQMGSPYGHGGTMGMGNMQQVGIPGNRPGRPVAPVGVMRMHGAPTPGMMIGSGAHVNPMFTQMGRPMGNMMWSSANFSGMAGGRGGYTHGGGGHMQESQQAQMQMQNGFYPQTGIVDSGDGQLQDGSIGMPVQMGLGMNSGMSGMGRGNPINPMNMNMSMNGQQSGWYS